MAAPVITVQPTNQVVNAPNPATFTLTATTDEGTLTYAWKKSVDNTTFTAIVGATAASYTTPRTALGDNSTVYRCTVTNDGGDTDSDVVGLQTIRTGYGGRITSLSLDALETIAMIDVEDSKVLWVQFICTVAALSEFTVEYRTHPGAPWFVIASDAADYTSPAGPILGASGDLTTAAASSSATRWLKLDVQGISMVRLQAAGTASLLVGYYRKG